MIKSPGHEISLVDGAMECYCGAFRLERWGRTEQLHIAWLEHLVEVLFEQLAATGAVAQEANHWASMHRPLGGS